MTLAGERGGHLAMESRLSAFPPFRLSSSYTPWAQCVEKSAGMNLLVRNVNVEILNGYEV
jgi:hypothetical protein